MSGINNEKINAAYVASWKEKNPKLDELKIDGHFLVYQNEKVDISEIYMQDILINPYTFQSIPIIESKDLFTIIKLHVCARQIKEKSLFDKARRRNNMSNNLEEMNINNNTVTTEDYFRILEQIEPLSPIDGSKKQRYRAFITMCENNLPFLDDESQQIYGEYKKELLRLYQKNNPTPLEKEEMEVYESRMNNVNTNEEEKGIGLSRTRSKAGYVDAVVILVLLLNIGFIIAMAILGSK